MAQISLYIDDVTASHLSAVAKSRNCSVSKYVAAVVSECLSREDADETRKKQLLAELQGALDDPTFVAPSDIPLEAELPRRFELL